MCLCLDLLADEMLHRSLALCTWGADGAAGLSRSSGETETVRCRWPAQDVYGGDISVVEYVPPNAQHTQLIHYTINRVELQKLTAVRDIVPWEQGTHS